ncbi:hypothetical protein RBU49_02395 [Clostridium sp. MB40-C1]|uniref:hypothetical protein n=1 Tax=Clostridium sp. MB40-C1 TaxID=3070996 RepID=UPI0027E1CDCA|nr:hypothetical protein [Clostridium sp. MB40-C1]WMJ81120.1 hypothetical protein RBU49_02395 [Clostridium sp. MB40-C1]
MIYFYKGINLNEGIFIVINNRDFYIIKQSDGTVWNFCFDEKLGLFYRILIDNRWSESTVISKNSSNNFSVVLFPNDSIYVLYQNLDNNIILSAYNSDQQWKEKQILQNTKKDMLEIYFKAILNENRMHILYSISNNKTQVATFFHQIVDENINLSQPKVIDTVNVYGSRPFIINASKENSILIMYQKSMDKYQLGYRELKNDAWSNFHIIEKNSYPYSDYSLLWFKETIYFIYIRDNKNSKVLVYCNGKYPRFNRNELFESINIDSCLLFILKDNIWINWIDKNNVYSSFSINNGKKFSMPPHYEVIDFKEAIKANYISNLNVDKESIIIDEVYIENKDKLNYIMLSNIYPYIFTSSKNNIDKKYNSYWVYIKDYMSKAYEQISNFEKLIKQKERLISQLKFSLEDEKSQIGMYESKYNIIQKKYDECEKGKELMLDNINSLQENLMEKDKKINELEDINLEKESQVISLNKKIDELEKSIHSLKEEFLNHKDKVSQLEDINSIKENEIGFLRNNIELQNSKIVRFEEESENLKKHIDNLEFELKSANTSIFKKIFGNNN